MRIDSSAETVSVEDGAIRLAFDLAGSEAAYLLISWPDGRAGDEEAFFGADHYVEVKDQLFGRYGGLRALSMEGEQQLTVQLSYTVPGVGSDLTITAREPLSDAIRSQLHRLERF